MDNQNQILILTGTLVIASIVWATTVLSAGLGEVVAAEEAQTESEQTGVLSGLLGSIVGIFL